MKLISTAEAFKKSGKVTLGGWVDELKILGGLKFIWLRDKTGKIQVTVNKKTSNKEVFNAVDTLTKESVILVTGIIKNVPQAPGGKEISPEKIELVNKAEQPVPLDISGHANSGLDARLDWRFLDLRKPEQQAIFRIQSVMSNAFRQHFYNKGFTEIQPPCVIAAASEGGAELFPVIYFDKEAFLAQSPQLYKQMVLASGFDKVFMTTPVWRAEPHATPRHLNEARQYDIEVAWANDTEALDYLEEVLIHIIKTVKKECKNELKLLKRDLKVPKAVRITYTEALKQLANEGITIEWGQDLTPEAERMLCKVHGEENFVFIQEWPTNVRAFYSMPKEGNENVCLAYDALYGGMELLSGATRVHKVDILEKQLRAKGLDPAKFKFYLDAFRYGCPPHSGWSFGLERLTMTVLGLSNIREGTLFARDQNRLTP
ncbi:aspartate--tRNA(Asn) ligase [archaeon CG10_big_fil_rev_8_21_14_0_10_43_11]|nr:MAG: aspartate--tRNA(Asn) ligase [archaeon CG10_big_fil_rev_8_21_14_0_10_43_11]